MATCRRVRSKSSEFILRIWGAEVRTLFGRAICLDYSRCGASGVRRWNAEIHAGAWHPSIIAKSPVRAGILDSAAAAALTVSLSGTFLPPLGLLVGSQPASKGGS
jgi:hypothetical protein